MKRIAIVQSNYIPWKGYFDLINLVDEFIIYDDVQYTRRDWRNRNKVKTQHGLHWLNIPVQVKGKYLQKINKVKTSNSKWGQKHWETIYHSYSSMPYFDLYKKQFENLFIETSESESLLSKINYHFICEIMRCLGISTLLCFSSDYDLPEGRAERLISLCLQLGATNYLSGPTARPYLDTDLFNHHGIQVEWMDYSGYNTYTQPFPPFEHKVTILDLLFCNGTDSRYYMKSFTNKIEAIT